MSNQIKISVYICWSR